jgi:hypothetical protein
MNAETGVETDVRVVVKLLPVYYIAVDATHEAGVEHQTVGAMKSKKNSHNKHADVNVKTPSHVSLVWSSYNLVISFT